MSTFSTIHIFGYGEAQIIGKDLNFKAKVSDFTKLQAVIDDVKSKKPEGKASKDHHAINIFDNSKVDYISVDKEASFSAKAADLNKTKITALVTEFGTLKAAYDLANPAVPA